MKHTNPYNTSPQHSGVGYCSTPLTFIFLALLSIAISGCSSPPREEQLRATIEAMELQLEQNEVAPFLDNVSEEFRFNQREDKAWIKRILTVLKFRKSNIEIVTTKIDLEIAANEEEADATINGYVASFQGMGIDQGRQFSLNTSWYYEGGEWQLYSVYWKNPPSFAGY